MKRSPLLRRTELRRYTPLQSVSPRRRAERAAAQPVIDAVFARDGGCLLRGHQHLTGLCSGRLTPHHLRKAWKGSGYTMHNLVALCAGHNGWVEDHPHMAWGLGLVVLNGGATGHAWAAMRNAGLPVPERLLERCDGSGEPVAALRLIVGGKAACLACGLTLTVVQNEDGGPGAWFPEHDKETRP